MVHKLCSKGAEENKQSTLHISYLIFRQIELSYETKIRELTNMVSIPRLTLREGTKSCLTSTEWSYCRILVEVPRERHITLTWLQRYLLRFQLDHFQQPDWKENVSLILSGRTSQMPAGYNFDEAGQFGHHLGRRSLDWICETRDLSHATRMQTVPLSSPVTARAKIQPGISRRWGESDGEYYLCTTFCLLWG